MKITILKNTVCGGKRVKAKKTIDASKEDAVLLVRMGKAKPADGAAKAAIEQARANPKEVGKD